MPINLVLGAPIWAQPGLVVSSDAVSPSTSLLLTANLLAFWMMPRFTPEQYLALEVDAPEKNEYYAGEIFAMSGGTAAHSQIITNTGAALHGRLKVRDCRTYSSELKIGVTKEGPFFYPDLSAAGGKPVLHSADHVLLNPLLVVEVLSKSTATFDRGLKLKSYKQIASLQAVLLVSQDRHSVILHFRSGRGWKELSISGLDRVVEIPSPACVVALADIYDGVTMPAAR